MRKSSATRFFRARVRTRSPAGLPWPRFQMVTRQPASESADSIWSMRLATPPKGGG